MAVFITLLLLNIILTLVVVTTTIAEKNDQVAIGPGNVDVCTSSGCVLAASNLLDSIDFSKDPCDDFANYVCGKWITNHPIPDDQVRYDRVVEVRDVVRVQVQALLQDDTDDIKSRAINMAKWYYKSCLDSDKLTKTKSVQVQKLIQHLGGWPLLNSSIDSQQFDLTDLMGQINREYGLDTLLSLTVNADQKNTSNNILTIDQGALGLGQKTRNYYLNDTLYSGIMNAYKKYILAHLTILANDMGLSDKYSSHWNDDIDSMIKFEKRLANITVAESERRNPTLLYNKWTVEKLMTSMTEINWANYLKTIMPESVYKGLFENKHYEVIITQPTYMDQLNDLIKATDKKTVVNYLIWQGVKSYAQYLDDRIDDISQDFLKVYNGRSQKPAKWKQCVQLDTTVLDFATGALYARKYFREEDKTEALNMIKYLKEAFKEIVHNLDWMDNKTKQFSINKIDTIIDNVGYPDFVMHDDKLDHYYENLTYNNETTYFEMNRLITVWHMNKDYLDLLKPYDRHKFKYSPAVVNAFYSPEKNSINFPAAFLQPPLFKSDYLKAVNYGAVGALIGHEITHGFDDQGRQFDELGNLRNWWSDSASENFKAKAQCVIKQYNEYSLPGIVQKINGKMTQGENIADNGGVKEAYKAYQMFLKKIGKEEPVLPGLNFTSDQLFFVSYGQVWCGTSTRANFIQQINTDNHSPNRFRIIGPLSNMDEFASAFQCKKGTTMNPDPIVRPKCEVW